MAGGIARLAGSAATFAFALASTAVSAQSPPDDDPRWLTTDLVWSAVRLIDTYQYKVELSDRAAVRVRETARGLSQDPPARFDACFDDSIKRTRMKSPLSIATEAAVACLKLDSAKPDRQRQINARLLEVLAATASPQLPSMPLAKVDRPIDFTSRPEPAPPAAGGGIGLSLMDVPGGKLVVDSRYSSPAREVGIAPGDVLVAIDGRNAAAMTLSEAAHALQGEPGSEVSLTVRAGESVAERILPLKRKSNEALNERMTVRREGALLIVDIRSMEGGESAMIEQAWEESGRGAKVLVLDLRFNGGGALDEAIALADLLLDKGTIATIEARSAVDRQVFTARPGGVALGIPVVVLTGPQTAAGAEILAAALHDNRQAVLVGQRTYGRGTIESLFFLHMRPDVPLKITTGEVRRADGSGFDQSGLTPDCKSDAIGAALVEAARLAASGACPGS